MPAITTITIADIKYACKVINQNPGRYGNQARQRAEATTTAGRYKQRRLAAGRDAIAECLFKLVPTLKGDYHRLTAAIRAGAIADTGKDADWGYINDLGARALGLPSEVQS